MVAQGPSPVRCHKLPKKILVVSPDQDHALLPHQLEDIVLQGQRLLSPVKEIAEQQKLFLFRIVIISALPQGLLKQGKKAVNIG